jgi:hypothetical protein
LWLLKPFTAIVIVIAVAGSKNWVQLRCNADFQNVGKKENVDIFCFQPFILLAPPDSPPQVFGDSGGIWLG